MDTAQAYDLVNKLSDHFQIPRPSLRFAGRGSVAYNVQNQIRLGSGYPGNPSSQEDILLHEFAHLLDYRRGTYNSQDPHGPGFFRALRDIVFFHRNDLTKYTWHGDYYKVYVAAYGAGYTRAPHFKHERRVALASGVRYYKGDRVTFVHRSIRMVGVIQNLRGFGRARVAVDGGRTWYVPQHLLTKMV